MTRPPSFIGFHPMPVRHGMTLGELARLYDAERKFGADLTVIACENWTRDQWLDQTGLPWTNPSPSMRSLTAATLYPGLCLLESTVLSMGRGTNIPFEQVGAPFVDGERLAAELNRAGIAGVRFEAVKFTPRPALYPGPANQLKYRDEECGGVRAVVTDRLKCPIVDIGIELALAMQRLYPGKFKTDAMARLLGADETLGAIIAGQSTQTIKSAWANSLANFNERREAFLLYPVAGRR
jgi:uncharacterized protein YbbC (DUF1343 family)